MTNSPQIDELMHAVLDGESSAEGQKELDRLMAEDVAVAERFEALRSMFDVLSRVQEVAPPVDLLDSAMNAFVVARSQSDQPRQISSQVRTDDARSHKVQHAGSPFFALIQTLRGLATMDKKASFASTTKGKVWIGAGAAAALAGVVILGSSAIQF